MQIHPNQRRPWDAVVRRWLWRASVGGGCVALLAACTSEPTHRVTSTSSTHREALSGDYYVVQRDDTLYSIAFRLDMNFKTLARINAIEPPYRIFVGQRLTVTKPRPAAVEPSRPPASRPTPPAVPTSPTAPVPTPASPPVPAPSPAPAPIAAVVSANTVPSAPTVMANSNQSVYDGRIPVVWRWPIKGAVARGFQDGGNKGIDITAHEGESVAVAANGKVVYSGQGLIGYGNLIIVKHSDQYLSAYGNNNRLLVQEGNEVTAGQSIAEVGPLGGRQPSLHFEVRRTGKPVNPLDYLPKR